MSKKQTKQNIKKYIEDNTKELLPYNWDEIFNHLNNLIEYYSYIADQVGGIELQARIGILQKAKEMMELDKQAVQTKIINLTKLDLIFLEYQLKQEIAEKVKDKSKINLNSFDVPGVSIKGETNDN